MHFPCLAADGHSPLTTVVFIPLTCLRSHVILCNRGTQPPYVCSHTVGAPPEIRGLTKAREGDRRPCAPFWLWVTSSLSGDLPPPVSVELRNLEPKQGYNDTTDVALAVSFLMLGLRRLWVRYLSLIW